MSTDHSRLAEEMYNHLEEKAEQLEVDCGPPEPCHDDWPYPPTSLEDDARYIESRMERVGNDINGNPRYVLHFLAFHSDYATAKDIANSIGWSVYRAKSHGGCFVGQSYSTKAEARDIAKARARLAERAGGAA